MTKFLFSLREAFKSFYKRAFVTWLSIATITGAIFVLGLFIFVSYNLHSELRGMQSQVHAEVFLKSDVSKKAAKTLMNKLENVSWIEKVKYVSPKQAKKIFKREFDEVLLEGLDENPLPGSIVIHFSEGKDLGEVALELKNFLASSDFVDASFLPSQTMQTLANARRIFIYLAIGWAIIILITSIIVVTNTIRLAMLSRKETIDVMKLVGADPSFIRLPFLLEGIFQGILSGALAVGLLYLINFLVNFALPSTHQLPDPMIIALGFFGLIFGIMGSRIAIGKYV